MESRKREILAIEEELRRNGYQNFFHDASARAVSMFWRRTGLRQYQVADKYGIHRVYFRMWSSSTFGRGPNLKKHYKLLIAMFHPEYEDVADDVFKGGVARYICAFYKWHLRVSWEEFVKMYGVSEFAALRWCRKSNTISPSLSKHFLLVKQILRFAVKRYEERKKREGSIHAKLRFRRRNTTERRHSAGPA